MKLSILIAAYNEEETLADCVAGILVAPLPAGLEREIVIVNDGSTDRTGAIADELAADHPEVRAFHQLPNAGKGAAIRRAIAEMSGELTIFQDADLEYDPRDYPRLLRPILEDRADVVFGSRFTGEERRILYFWHALANSFLTLLSNMLNDTIWTDMETCYKVFRSDLLRRIPLESDRFGIEPEITAKVARHRVRMYEVPITYNGRRYEEGKKITWRDGAAALWFIFKYRFSSRYADAGKVALDSIERAPRFTRWTYDKLRPFLGTRIAELGAGRGNLSRHLRAHGHLLLTDYRADYLHELQHRWKNKPNFAVARLDLTLPADYAHLRDFQPDTVVLANVLEHIEHDETVLSHLHGAVPPGCQLIALVPYGPKLYSRFDREIGHFRRYDHGELETKVRRAGFEIVKQFYFNKSGVVAWYFANTLGRQPRITPFQLRVYNLLTPLFRLLDPVLPGPGLSTIVIAKKTGAATSKQ